MWSESPPWPGAPVGVAALFFKRDAASESQEVLYPV